ncbi:MAG: DUF4336 domain-containing protein [Myxococcota bacterium]
MTANGELRAVDRGLWVKEEALRVGGLQLGARMTVVQLSSGDLVLLSPVSHSDALARELERIGPVRFVVCPNLRHHLFAATWLEAHPDARLSGPAGLRRKAPALGIRADLEEPPPADWAADLAVLPVQGFATFDEFVFVHRPTRTLVVADLVMNFQSARGVTRLYLRANRALGHPSHTVLHRIFFRDRAAVRRSVEAILETDFDRLVVAHGEIVETGAKAALREAFSWV